MRTFTTFALLALLFFASLLVGSSDGAGSRASQRSSEMVVSIRSINKDTYLHWVTAERGGGTWVKTVPALTSTFFKFILVDANGGQLTPGDKVYLRTPNNNTPGRNTYVRLSPEGVITADLPPEGVNRTERGEFIITNVTRPEQPIGYDDWIALRTFNGQWWLASSRDNGKVTVGTAPSSGLDRPYYFQLCNPDIPSKCKEYDPDPPPTPGPINGKPPEPDPKGQIIGVTDCKYISATLGYSCTLQVKNISNKTISATFSWSVSTWPRPERFENETVPANGVSRKLKTVYAPSTTELNLGFAVHSARYP